MGLTSRKTKLIIHSLVFLLVGGGLLVALLRVIGVEETVARLRSADLTLLGLALLLFCSQAITMAVRWWLALRMCGHRVSLVSCIRANSASNVINFLAPGHFGEPAATAWLGKTGRGPGVEAFAVLVACKAIATVLNLLLI